VMGDLRRDVEHDLAKVEKNAPNSSTHTVDNLQVHQ
jgi:hypothetical protein